MEQETRSLNELELAFLDSLAMYQAIFSKSPQSVNDWRVVLKEVDKRMAKYASFVLSTIFPDVGLKQTFEEKYHSLLINKPNYDELYNEALENYKQENAE